MKRRLWTYKLLVSNGCTRRFSALLAPSPLEQSTRNVTQFSTLLMMDSERVTHTAERKYAANLAEVLKYNERIFSKPLDNKITLYNLIDKDVHLKCQRFC